MNEDLAGIWAELARSVVRETDAGKPPPCVAKPDLGWTADDPEKQAEAALGCAVCPLIRECAAFAEWSPETTSVWGGSTVASRRAEWDFRKSRSDH